MVVKTIRSPTKVDQQKYNYTDNEIKSIMCSKRSQHKGPQDAARITPRIIPCLNKEITLSAE